MVVLHLLKYKETLKLNASKLETPFINSVYLLIFIFPLVRTIGLYISISPLIHLYIYIFFFNIKLKLHLSWNHSVVIFKEYICQCACTLYSSKVAHALGAGYISLDIYSIFHAYLVKPNTESWNQAKVLG